MWESKFYMLYFVEIKNQWEIRKQVNRIDVEISLIRDSLYCKFL